jgi:hypothetical protein
MGHQMDIFLKAYSVHTLQFLLTSLKTPKKSRIKVLFRLSFSVIGRFSSFSRTMSLMARFQNNFKDHRPLLEQLLESMAAANG